MKGLGFPIVDANHIRDAGRRRGFAVRSHDLAREVLARSISGLDGIGTESAHDQSTVSVGGSGWAVGIHSDGLLFLILPHCVCGFLQAILHLELREP